MTWEEIKASFDAAYAKDHVIQSILADNKITYAEANRYAILDPSTMFSEEKVSAFIILMICIV